MAGCPANGCALRGGPSTRHQGGSGWVTQEGGASPEQRIQDAGELYEGPSVCSGPWATASHLSLPTAHVSSLWFHTLGDTNPHAFITERNEPSRFCLRCSLNYSHPANISEVLGNNSLCSPPAQKSGGTEKRPTGAENGELGYWGWPSHWPPGSEASVSPSVTWGSVMGEIRPGHYL